MKEIKPITEGIRELPAVPQLQAIAPPPPDEEEEEEEGVMRVRKIAHQYLSCLLYTSPSPRD